MSSKETNLMELAQDRVQWRVFISVMADIHAEVFSYLNQNYWKCQNKVMKKICCYFIFNLLEDAC
jgi:hypothetical protein